jgi:hypothetical protein
MLADLLWCILMFVGIEHVQFKHGIGAANYSFSSAVAWAYWMKRHHQRRTRSRSLASAMVVSMPSISPSTKPRPETRHPLQTTIGAQFAFQVHEYHQIV